VDGLELAYKGVFDARELYKIIDLWYREKAYTKHEIKNYENVYADGKEIEVQKEPYRKISDYAKYVIRTHLFLDGVQEIVVEREGARVRMNKGNIKIILTGYLEYDYEHRWEKKPLFYFLRAVFDQFVYKVNSDKFEAGLVEEVNQLHTICKSFLNLYRY